MSVEHSEGRKWGEFLLAVVASMPGAFMISTGVNLQQNGYRDKDEFMMFWGVLTIAAGLQVCRALSEWARAALGNLGRKGNQGRSTTS